MKKLPLILIFFISSLFAGGDRFYDYARVSYSEPIYEYVHERIPNTECKNIRYDDGYYSQSDDSLGIDTLVGVAAGAVLGSQVGKGNGRVAAQIVGGLLGGKVAHEIRNNYKPNSRYYNTHGNRTKCYNSYDSVRKKVITRYKNYFVYNGTEHFKVTNRPIRRVKVTHTINF